MRIALIVTDLSPPRMGGISKVATEITRHLCAKGHSVSVFCLERNLGTFELFEGLELVAIRPKYSFYKEYPVVSFSLSAFSELVKRHQQNPFDISHAMNFNNFAFPFYSRTLKKLGLPHVSTAFETTWMELAAKCREFRGRPGLHLFAQIAMETFLAPWQRAYIGWADAITTEDVETRSGLLRMRISAKKIHLVPSGIDLSVIQKQESVEFREALKKKGSPLILCPGRIDPRKGCQYLVEAFFSVREDFPNAHLILAGGGRGSYAKDIQKLVDKLNLNDSVTLTGEVPDLKPYYQACDRVIIPSLSEGIPITLQEALAFKKPVVCSKLQGTYEYAKGLASIDWVEPANVPSLKLGILKSLRKDEPKAVLEGFAFIKNYDWSLVAKRYLEVYESVL